MSESHPDGASDPAAWLHGEEAAAHDTIVIGAGIAGLTVARDLASRGYRVLVLEASDRVGGVVASHAVAGIELDAGAESFATRGDAVAALLADIGLADAVATPASLGAWVQLESGAVPLPKAGLLGIPTQPLASDVIAVLGMSGAWRAYLDRVMPFLRVGQDRELGPLVRRRMGQKVLDRLVSPVAGGIHSASADDLDVALVAPGLNPAITRAGSLSGGAALVREERTVAGGAVLGIEGGMHRLATALADDAIRFHAEIRTGASAETLEQTTTGWAVMVGGERLAASSLVVATPAHAAIDMLAGVPGFAAVASAAWPQATDVELVTLVVDSPALASNPRGTGMLVAADATSVTAKALTHATAKWPWLRQVANGREVLRLSYGTAGSPPATADMSDAECFALARRDAEAMLGVTLPEPVGAARVRLRDGQPSATVGARDRQRIVADAAASHATLEVVGAWVAGTGLASVVPHAREAALRIRRTEFAVPGLPWGEDGTASDSTGTHEGAASDAAADEGES